MKSNIVGNGLFWYISYAVDFCIEVLDLEPLTPFHPWIQERVVIRRIW